MHSTLPRFPLLQPVKTNKTLIFKIHISQEHKSHLPFYFEGTINFLYYRVPPESLFLLILNLISVVLNFAHNKFY